MEIKPSDLTNSTVFPTVFFVASLHLYFLFIFPFLPAVCLYGDVTQVVTMLSVSLSDLNQALSLVGSSFLVKSHWKPNLKLASRGLHRTCCIVLSISNEFNTLCGRSVATRRFIAAFVQLSMHLSYYTEWQGFMNSVKELLELHCCSLLRVIVCCSSRIYIW